MSWTIDTLKEYVDKLREADKEAILKAEALQTSRDASANEWRQAMLDRERKFAQAEETERRLKALEDAAITGKGRAAGIGQIAGAAAVIVATIAALAAIMQFWGGG